MVIACTTLRLSCIKHQKAYAGKRKKLSSSVSAHVFLKKHQRRVQIAVVEFV